MNRLGLCCCLLLSTLAVGGCQGQGQYRLHLVFPDEQSKEIITEIHLWALDANNGSCAQLIAGAIRPENLTIRAQLQLLVPSPGAAPMLANVPSGRQLFFAEGIASDQAILLRGCSEVEVQADDRVEVTIELTWICQPNPAGEIMQNGMDDDCDGLTDECVADADCDDASVCTSDICLGETCHATPYPDSLQCDDHNQCTTHDACRAGICTGEARDCHALDGLCRRGACDSDNGECIQESISNETCDDGLACTLSDSCQNGSCAGIPKNCDDANPCTKDNCDEVSGDCVHTLEPKPGLEGPEGTCDNGMDDDCDGLTDLGDPNCVACVNDIDCDDRNSCTQDSCDPQSHICANLPVADATTCSDSLFCTISEQCLGGVCKTLPRDCSQVADQCNDAICEEGNRRCAPSPKVNGTTCEDGPFCTEGNQCVSGVCSAGTPRTCDDQHPCTWDECLEDQNRCLSTWQQNPGAEGPPGTCNNGMDDDCDHLTDMEDPNCQECQSPEQCDDLNPCTTDSCSYSICLNDNVTDNDPCDDGNPCSTLDSCQAGRCEVGATNKDGDNDSYLDGACPNGTDCNDQNAAVHPGAQEGPFGDGTCLDGLDNDCDGWSDQQDFDCSATPLLCNQGWCWEHPLPQGNSLHDLWGFGSSDIWAVGEAGTILHWDGNTWSQVVSNTTDDLHGIWGVSAQDIWTVGNNGTILRWDGSLWSKVDNNNTDNLYSVWGTSDTDVWAVGDCGVVLRWTGVDWLGEWPVGNATLWDIWGTSAMDIWTVSSLGQTFHWNGSAWSVQSNPAPADLYGVWGWGEGDYWAVGAQGTSVRWNGSSWGDVTNPSDGNWIFNVWGTGANDVWMTGVMGEIFHWAASSWTQVDNGAQDWIEWLRGIWGPSSDDVWMVGYTGSLHHWDGGHWAYLSNKRGFNDINDLWGSSISDVWAATYGQVLRRDANGWSPIKIPEYWSNLFGVWGTSPDNVWAVGQSGAIFQWTGGSWTDHSIGGTSDFNDVHGSSASDVWAVGDAGMVRHWNGSTWSNRPQSITTEYLEGVWVSPSGVAWVVGSLGGLILRWDPGSQSWSSISAGSNTYWSVWGTGDSDIWAVGDGGTIRRYNGTNWINVNSHTSHELFRVWGTSENDVWAGGRYGALLHWNGSDWSDALAGTRHTIRSMWGAAGELWIAGEAGIILRKQH